MIKYISDVVKYPYQCDLIASYLIQCVLPRSLQKGSWHHSSGPLASGSGTFTSISIVLLILRTKQDPHIPFNSDLPIIYVESDSRYQSVDERQNEYKEINLEKCNI